MLAPIEPNRIRATLSELALKRPIHALARQYQQFYGLDLPHHPCVHSALGIMPVAQHEVVAQLWWPPQPKATLLLLHGYYDHMGLYTHVLDWALSQEYCVLSCDLPGHGLSSGEQACIQDFAEYQSVLQALSHEAQRLGLPTPWHLMGQSTGAAIITDYLLHHPAPTWLGQSILLAPLIRPQSWASAYWLYRLIRPWATRLPRHFTANSHDQAFLTFVRQDPLQSPVLSLTWVGALARWISSIEQAPSSSHQPLILQGTQDATVDWPYNLSVLQQKFHQPKIYRISGARHHLVNELPTFRQPCFAFLNQELVR